MSEAGLDVITKPKIHCQELSVEDHSIFNEETGVHILLSLNGIFSVFKTRALTQEEISKPDDYEMIFLSPDSPVWNPYDESYTLNEAAHLDIKQELVRKLPRKFDLLEDDDFDDAGVSAVHSKREMERPSSPTVLEDFANEEEQIDAMIASSIIHLPGEPDADEQLRFKDDFGRAEVIAVSSVLDPDTFLDSLNMRAAQSQFAAAIGATHANDGACEPFESIINRIRGTVSYMRPLNYWLHCRPMILHDIVIQIE